MALGGEKILPSHNAILCARLEDTSPQTKDPRMLGNGGVSESYTRYSPIRNSTAR